MQRVLDIAHEPKTPRADQHAGDEIPDDGAKAKPLEERHDDHRCGEEDRDLSEHRGMVCWAGRIREAEYQLRMTPATTRAAGAKASASLLTAPASDCLDLPRRDVPTG